MLMDGCDLLQQHLHLLTAVGGGEGVRLLWSEGVSSDLNLSEEAPFVAGQHLRQLGLLDLQLLQPALELLDAGGVNGQVLVDLQRQETETGRETG